MFLMKRADKGVRAETLFSADPDRETLDFGTKARTR